MNGSQRAASPANTSPSVAIARAALLLLTVLNFLNYVDRYVLAAVLERIKLDPAFAGATDASLGALQSAFFYSYMVLSPIAGLLARRLPRRYLVAIGVAVWSLATIGSGLSRTYWELLASRSLIGFGEAGYATVAPALLSDLFHRDKRNRVLSLFYLATPVGSALGFVIGGKVAEVAGWRSSFFVAGVPGLALALLALLLPEPRRGAQDLAPVEPGPPRRFLDEIGSLARNRDFIRVTLGGALMVFSVGGLAFWMPSYMQAARGLGVGDANLIVGGTAVVSGILGTLGGGLIADAWARRDRRAYLRVSGISMILAGPVAFCIPFAGPMPLLIAVLFFAQLFSFGNTGPLNTALVNSTPPSVREAAVGINIFFIHALGDAVSPALLGAFAGALEAHGFARPDALGWAVAATGLPVIAGGLLLLGRGSASPATTPEQC